MKRQLEEAFDIPFHVEKNIDTYLIYPENEMEEFFEIRVSFRSEVRLIIEAYPQSHAAAMLNDMATASKEKQDLFLGYIETFIRKQAKVTIKVNGIQTDLHEWPAVWKNLYIRITRIEEPDVNYEEVATEFSVLAAGLMLSLLNVVPLEGYADGKKTQVLVNRYERNPLNRELCLQLHGYSCSICGMNFENVYGPIGKSFIHVHHIEPVSMMGGSYVLDPGKDLIPVCPNCHAMLHTRKPPLQPEELIEIMKENNKCEE